MTDTNYQYISDLIDDGREYVNMYPCVDMEDEILHRCSNMHEWMAKPNDILSGDGCPYCG